MSFAAIVVAGCPQGAECDAPPPVAGWIAVGLVVLIVLFPVVLVAATRYVLQRRSIAQDQGTGQPRDAVGPDSD